MSRSDGVAVIFVVAVAVFAGLAASFRSDGAASEPKMLPVVGRTASEQAMGVGPLRLTVPEQPPVYLPDLERIDALLAPIPWPDFARDVLIFPVDGAAPAVTLEEGSPYHLELSMDGTVSLMSRFTRGRPGVPPGIPARSAARGVHLVIPDAAQFSLERTRVLRALIYALRTRLDRDGRVKLCDRVEGATVSVPASFPRALVEGE